MHLEAALEQWRYCSDSAAFIFGESLGDPLAEAILEVLLSHRESHPEGMTRTEVWGCLGRNGDKAELDAAIGAAQRNGSLRTEKRKSLRGRPADVLQLIHAIPGAAHDAARDTCGARGAGAANGERDGVDRALEQVRSALGISSQATLAEIRKAIVLERRKRRSAADDRARYDRGVPRSGSERALAHGALRARKAFYARGSGKDQRALALKHAKARQMAGASVGSR